MKVVYPIANGNWSTVANWYSNGSPYGQLPQTGDIVCANGFTIAIDIDLNAYTFVILTTVATSPAVAGGGFTCATGGYTIRATSIINGSSICLTLSHTIGNTITIYGTSFGSMTTKAVGGAIKNSSTGAVVVFGNIRSGNGGLNNNYGFENSSTGTVTITGDVYSEGTGAYRYGLYNVSTGSITITGNVYCNGGHYTNYGIYNAAAANITITGNVTAAAGAGIYNNSTGTISVMGTVTGGSGGAAYGIFLNSTSILNIIGTVTSSATFAGIYSSSNCAVYVRGIITMKTPPTATVSAITLTTGTLYVSGVITNKSSTMAVQVLKMVLLSTASTMWTFVNEIAGTKNLYTADVSPLGNPAPNNVRSGILFGPANELMGSLIVPPKSSVAKNVPTDDGVGTMEMLPSDFWAYANRTLTAGNLTAQEVWEYVNRTITSGGITAAEIWGYLFTSVLPDDSFGKLFKDYLNAKVGDIPAAVINELTSSMEDVAVRIRNLATTEIVGDIHAT
jgi:hypothetical protein